MKEELVLKLLELINKSESLLEDQLPEVANQLLVYGRIDSYGTIILFSLTLLTGFGIIFYFRNKESDFVEGFRFVAFSGSLFSFIIVLCGIYRLIQSYLAPKAYLIHMILHNY